MMEIKKFVDNDFGSLTTIKNPKTGNIMFIAKEVAEQWGHSNITQSLKRLLDDTEKVLITRTKHPEIMEEFALNNLLSAKKTQKIWLINESGLYKLALSSNLDRAKPFKDWVTKTVLPQIRQTGSFSFTNVSVKELSQQTVREVQLENSKGINKKNYEEGGVAKIIDYNRDNCRQVVGIEPSQIKKIYGKKNLSAKEILRKTNPELAATMSLNDYIVSQGATLEQLKELDAVAVKTFKELIKLGFTITDGN